MNLFKVSAPPHIRAVDDTRIIMLDVIIALLPALIAGAFFFGYRAVVIAAVSVASAVAFEHLWNVLFHKPTTVGDLSAVVSGLLLALNLPALVPLWIPVVGSLFMIIIVKMCFGGLGQNFVNPALAARAFLMASWPGIMTTFPQVYAKLGLLSNPDAVTCATPLSGAAEQLPGYLDLFIGNVGGCIGETSAAALLIGAAYLLFRRVINWRIPFTYLATVGVFMYVFAGETLFTGDALFHLLAGGLLLGAFFMATDYTTSPVTPVGQVLYGVGCGLLTCIIRLWGGYPEGVTYSILLMNIATPLLEKVTPPRRFGKGAASHA